MVDAKRTVLVFTAADIWRDRKSRREEYKLGHDSVIEYLPHLEILYLETRRKRKSVLEQFGQVTYSKSHRSDIANKGVLLILALKSFLKGEDENLQGIDNIIVMTGRYRLTSRQLYESILACPADIDFVGREFAELNQVHTGLFLINKEFLKVFLSETSTENMERSSISIEHELWRFLTNRNATTYFLPSLDLYAPVFGKGIRDTHVF